MQRSGNRLKRWVGVIENLYPNYDHDIPIVNKLLYKNMLLLIYATPKVFKLQRLKVVQTMGRSFIYLFIYLLVKIVHSVSH